MHSSAAARRMTHRLATYSAALVALALPVAASAQSVSQQKPKELENVKIEQKLGDDLPLDAVFRDEQGNDVKLGDFFTGDRPVILTPVYYNCPMLCTLVLNGLVDGLEPVKLTVGTDFDIVTFSFAAEETPELANRKKRAYLTQYDREGAAEGWHFLTGSQESIDTVCEAIGFKYNRLDNGQIAHSASIVFITPDGRISSYQNDVTFQPKNLRLALVDASEGTIRAPLENFLLFTCFRYDPDSGGYVASAWKIMRFFGGVTVLLLGGTLFMLFRAEAKRKHREMQHHDPASGGGMQTS